MPDEQRDSQSEATGPPAVPAVRRVVVAGASGLIGTAFVDYLTRQGIQVDTLVRREPKPQSREIHWDPAHQELEAAALAGADVVVNLAGENIGSSRWNDARKKAIRESRVQSEGV